MYLNNLQTFIFAAILSLFLMFVACSKNNIAVILTELGASETLKPGEKISFGKGNNLIKINFKSLEDSRCPINANCIRAGEAVTNLTIEDRDKQVYEVRLAIGESSGFKPDTVEITIRKKPYRIILEEVLPYPELYAQQDESATFHFFSL